VALVTRRHVLVLAALSLVALGGCQAGGRTLSAHHAFQIRLLPGQAAECEAK